MKKISIALLTLVLAFVGTNTVKAQSTIEVDGISKPAVRVEFNAHDNDVKDALESYFEKMGNKWKKSRGVYSTTNVALLQISPEKLDLLFTIDSKGRNSKELTTVLMAVKPTVDVFVGDNIPSDMAAKVNAFSATIPTIVADYVKQKEVDKLAKEAAKDEANRKKAEKNAAKQTEEAKESKKKLEEAKEKN